MCLAHYFSGLRKKKSTYGQHTKMSMSKCIVYIYVYVSLWRYFTVSGCLCVRSIFVCTCAFICLYVSLYVCLYCLYVCIFYVYFFMYYIYCLDLYTFYIQFVCIVYVCACLYIRCIFYVYIYFIPWRKVQKHFRWGPIDISFQLLCD